jgi:predicted RNA-binding Zn ribbon-like protein
VLLTGYYRILVSMRSTIALPPADDERLLLAVANTGHVEHDELSDPTRVATWWAGVHGAPWSGDLGDDSDVDVLRAARRLVRALGLRNNGVEVDASSDASTLAQLPLRFALEDGPALTVAADTTLPRFVAASALVALVRRSSQPHWTRVKACPGPNCAWVFVDRSRNGSRRWCDMAECGNRAKGAAFRARTRATR